jgi:1,4-alpha-glucan branching enzyme
MSPGVTRQAELDLLAAGRHHHPHAVLGAHPDGDRTRIRAWQPAAQKAWVLPAGDGAVLPMQALEPAGVFEAEIAGGAVPGHRFRFANADGEWTVDDPYAFLPTLGELDLHLVTEGRHLELWRRLGARVIEQVTGDRTVSGTAFAVWAPNAQAVSVASDLGYWDERVHPMRSLGSSGVWELFIPGAGAGTRYKFSVLGADGRRMLHADPMARATEVPPSTASVVEAADHAWGDQEWIDRRRRWDGHTQPLSIYEVHPGSWRRDTDGEPLGYRDLGVQLADYAERMGFTHVELMPVMEHPFAGSWGYQVTGYFAPTSRFGAPDDLRWMIDHLHQRGIGVLVDWVPAHFPKDEWALARFDGTALYEHEDPRLGEHPDWGTLIFNYTRNEVRNFLVASAHYWAEEFHVDGLRVDAVASMLYLDYSRKAGEWVPNEFGGRENLAAVDFLRETNATLAERHPGVMVIAEESTSWGGVTRPASAGGLGFSHKWNMGWMHDTLEYMSNDPVFRRYHHGEMTFGLLYAWSEHFILPLSHDEVVHGKGSLLGKMPGDPWRRHANLRGLLAWMWAHPGKQLLFMGGEIAQIREWSHERGLDWDLLDQPLHAGNQRLVADLNHAYTATPALWELDSNPDTFEWIDAGNADQNVLSFIRRGRDRRPGLVCIAHFSPEVRGDFRVGLPHAGRWREALNTDAEVYGGGNVGNWGSVSAEEVGWNGQPASAVLTLPPLGVIWLMPDSAAAESVPASVDDAAPDDPTPTPPPAGRRLSPARRAAGR